LTSLALFVFAAAPFGVLLAKQDPQDPKSEEIYVNIRVFKGVPASDLIPAMEFMCASMKWECNDCHEPNNYPAETHAKETTRQMVQLQRDINEKWFNGRLEVTCMTCHNGQEHPDNTPVPGELTLRHGRVSNPPKTADLFAKHIAAAGKQPAMVTLTGTLTAPNDATHAIETKPLELSQAIGGKFRLVSGDRVVVCNGPSVTYGGAELWGEPVSLFKRIGRTWWGEGAFAGLEGMAVSGRDKLGPSDIFVVRANRAATASQEELYFDIATGLLTKLVNMKRSTIGTVVSAVDYEEFRMTDGTNVPMKVTVTFAGGQQWKMEFSGAKVSETVNESLFTIG
jgi:hypothetical protein